MLLKRPAVLILASVLFCGEAAIALDYGAAQTINGQRYAAVVPDTLDLAERAMLAVHGLTDFLNPGRKYAPYLHAYFNVQTPYMTDSAGEGATNWGKIMESLVMMRTVSGSDYNLDIQNKSFDGMVAWTKYNASTPDAEAMQALMSLYQLYPRTELRDQIARIARPFIDKAIVQNGMAYHYDMPADLNDTKLGVLGYGWAVFIQGKALHAASRYYDLFGATEYADLAAKLKKYVLQNKFWTGEGDPKAVAGNNSAHFNGHTHSYLAALKGLAYYAELTGDIDTMRFVRNGYEYVRNFGIARIGMFGEACATGDMTWLALKLSRAGVGDYWDDADCYIRNHLAEMQITDANKLTTAAGTAPIMQRWYPDLPDTVQQEAPPGYQCRPLNPLIETEDNVINRSVGTFLSDSSRPAVIPKHSLLRTICCTGNCTRALYSAWESIVKENGESTQVNLLLNRAAKSLDVDSYLPYEGKVVVRNKTAKNLSVRIPGYVDTKTVKMFVNDRLRSAVFSGRYILCSVNPGDVVSITFALKDTVEQYTLKWKQTDFWMESTNPGSTWTPNAVPDVFALTMRANTLVSVSPATGTGYHLYQRDSLTATTAPMHTVQRYVPSVLIRW